MRITDFSLKNRVTIFFLLFIITAGGISAYFNLGKLEDPEFTIKTALIMTPYPGASPHEVEQEVTRKIEEAVQAADKVEYIRSESRAGYSMVYVDLYENVRSDTIQQLWDIVRRKVEAVQSKLPEGALPSQVMDDYGDVFGIFLALTGDGLEQRELKKYAKYIKRELLLVNDVEKINLFGVQDETVNIEIDTEKAANLGIHPSMITRAVKDQNTVVVSGEVKTDSRRIRISQTGKFRSVEEIENLIIQAGPENQIRIKDIARVTREYNDPPSALMRFNGKEAVGIAISATSDANVVIMGDAVKKRMNELLQELPLGMEISGIYYQSEFVKEAIKKFMTNLLESVAIVVFVLLVSMGLRPGFIIASNLILSILATFIVMLVLGINLQQISLAALILVMGMIVDNAIVVAEGSQTLIQSGKEKMEAVVLPASQTAVPLLGATIIAGLAFMPIYFAPNNTGEYVGSLSIVVSVSLLISWVLAMSQTPVFSFYLLKPSKNSGNRQPYSSFFYRIYKKLLHLALTNRTITIILMIAVLFAGVSGFKNVKKNFFAESEKDQFFVDYKKPEGTRIESVSADMEKFEKYLETRNDIENFATCIGEGAPRFAAALTPEAPNPAFAQIVINVKNYRQINKMIPDFEKWFKNNLPDGSPHIWKYISGPRADYKVEARITGNDPKILRDLSEKIQIIMNKNQNAKSVTNDWKERVLSYELDYSQTKAKKAGIERSSLSFSALAATDGIPVSNFKEGDELIPVKFKYSDTDPDNFDGLPVWGSSAVPVPLAQVVNKTNIDFQDPVIRRYNRKRVIRAQCDPVHGVTADTLLSEIRPEVEKINLPAGYKIEWEGEHELSDRGNKGVQKNLPVCLLFMLIILVYLFNSVKQPLMIILTIPFALIGIAGGLLVMNQPFGFLPILGAYSLIGMLIKNAVVLIDEINFNIKSGIEKFKAIETSSINRARPVILASLTTIFGMTPLLGDAMFVSMAVTIMFGLLAATFLTLFLIPVLYSIFYNIKPSKTGALK
jgi:multidrug efflux pump subunit AcrB